jgi:hypothetical protein
MIHFSPAAYLAAKLSRKEIPSVSCLRFQNRPDSIAFADPSALQCGQRTFFLSA